MGVKTLPHPDDPSLVITPPDPPEERSRRINNLITTATLSASIGLVVFVSAIAVTFLVRVLVGDFEFRTSGAYLIYMGAYLGLVVGLMIAWAMSMELSNWIPKWEIEKQPEWEDPYDKSPDWR